MNSLRVITAITASLAILGMLGGEKVFAASADKSYDFEKLSKDPQFVKSMIAHMKKNHDFTQTVLKSMLVDPALRLQMLGHMTENKEAMKEISQMMKESNQKMKSMDHSTMKPDGKKKTG